ncbi:Eco57I restriction-modification methylase domain-containing protein [Agrococcus sp. TSP3-2-1]|uniref:Eco57I restriction-modification methylase domain-containing protein n=1 Tax=Agrococcus sp. TSP3-2-1 TaxID=2804583 RepID=UPI003CFB2AFA
MPALQLQSSTSVAWSEAGALASDAIVHLGRDDAGAGAMQVGVATLPAQPTKGMLETLWKSRSGRAPMGFIAAVVAPGGVWIHYPASGAPSIGPITVGQAERQLQSVLDERDGLAAHAQIRAIQEAMAASGSDGFSNHFLFATYHLLRDVPKRADWQSAGEAAATMLPKRGAELVAALGFSSETAGSDRVLVLRTATGPRRAVAVLLKEDEQFDQKSATYQLTPVAKALEVAGREDVPWVIAVRKSTLRLYPGRDGVGVGQRGQSETYFELDLALLAPEQAALLTLIFSAAALDSNGSAQQLLDGSGKYAADLGTRLRDRVYEGVVPSIALAVAEQLPSLGIPLDADGLQNAYRVTMRILFRLLFQAYGEATELLPAGRNEHYDANSLQTFIALEKDTEPDQFAAESAAIWSDLVQVWEVIFHGNGRWEVPAYGGSLFDPGSGEGALIGKLRLTDRVLGPALQQLLSEQTVDGSRGPVDFRSLQVREFGTIYEGLLESSLSVAEQDLALDAKGAFVPAKEGDRVEAFAGRPYFHSASGERKATGSYYTPKVVVDHLIERSVEPALHGHLERVRALMDSGKDRAAADAFFDFRVADLAMGSAHFLVAAVDKIERGMRDFLTVTEVPGVRAELARLAETARDALGADMEGALAITEGQLLRRQVARRCIYGLDINPLAVELSQLALWIHTFVPGLPMSSLDHGLVLANSLTGIGTIDEALEALGAEGVLEPIIREPLSAARDLLLDHASASEADKSEVAEGVAMLERARAAAAPAKAMFDVAVAKRLGRAAGEAWDEEQFVELASTDAVRSAVEPLHPAHMPYLFPEVFLRDRPGFDVLIGNPPWEEVMVEEPKFWLRVRPGLLGLKPAALKAEIARLRVERADLLPELQREIDSVEALRKVLLAGPYPGLGTGDVDLYSAFAWRFWHLLRSGGRSAIVVPRSQFNAAGGRAWRETVLPRSSAEIVVLLNNRRWVFPIHPQYAIALAALEKVASGRVALAGPFASETDFLDGRHRLGVTEFATISEASAAAAIPNLPDAKSVEVFAQIRQAPRLDAKRPGWDFRPVAEFHATNDRKTFDDGPESPDRIPVRGGAGFDLWTPETSEVYAWADPAKVEAALQAKRQRQIGLKSSAFFGKPASWAADASTLPLRHPRIAFRDVTNATNTRTSIAALVPPGTVLTNKAPYVFRYAGDAKAEAYLLGILSSVPLDWYARKYVEMGMNLHIFNGLPIPEFLPASVRCQRVTEIAGRLAAADSRYRAWAGEIGVEVGSAKAEPIKSALIAELDALVASLYGLTRDQFEHIFATFHRGWDYRARLDRSLAYFDEWSAR